MHRISLLATGLVSLLTASTTLAQTSARLGYQGLLRDAGQLVSGSIDVRATLWRSPEGGTQLAGPIDIPGVAVDQGLFSLEIPFDTLDLPTTGYYLQLEINSGGGFETLMPRQRYNPAPAAVQATGAQTDATGQVGFQRTRTTSDIARYTIGIGDTDQPATSAWQSFTTTSTALLSSALFNYDLADEPVDALFTLYQGEGTAGAALATAGPSFIGFGSLAGSFDGQVELAANEVYTIGVETFDAGGQPDPTPWDTYTTDPFPGGRSSFGPGVDHRFSFTGLELGGFSAGATTSGTLFASNGLSITGDIMIPPGSIDQLDIADEPGLARERAVPAFTLNQSLFQFPIEESITAPGPGYIIATYRAEAAWLQNVNQPQSFTFGISDRTDQVSNSSTSTVAFSGSSELQDTRMPITTQAVFQATGGPQTFYVIAFKAVSFAPDVTLTNQSLTLHYVPGAYGTVDRD